MQTGDFLLTKHRLGLYWTKYQDLIRPSDAPTGVFTLLAAWTCPLHRTDGPFLTNSASDCWTNSR